MMSALADAKLELCSPAASGSRLSSCASSRRRPWAAAVSLRGIREATEQALVVAALAQWAAAWWLGWAF